MRRSSQRDHGRGRGRDRRNGQLRSIVPVHGEQVVQQPET